MKREQLVSSSLRSAGYDEHNKIFEVEFLNGDVYRYFEVPPEIYTDFCDADSHGRFYVQFIRDSFEFKKLPERLT
jgi:hypothetical protein